MIILLLIIAIGYVLMSYKKLIKQHESLEDMQKELAIEMTDKLRREYNAIARDYNNTLSCFIGKRLAHKLKYEKKEIIEKI